MRNSGWIVLTVGRLAQPGPRTVVYPTPTPPLAAQRGEGFCYPSNAASSLNMGASAGYKPRKVRYSRS
jgi:hypothetical protein